MNIEPIHFNGINGDNGAPLTMPLSLEIISRIARGEKIDEKHLEDLKWRKHSSEKNFAPMEGVDRKSLAESGWGVIFAFADPAAAAIREALEKLLRFRREQAGDLYKEYLGSNAYRAGESKQRFLARNGAGPGPVNPRELPYYLLIVGDPEHIPFRFQYQLDVQYAVGRLHFENIDDYANYADSVVASESGQIQRSRRAVFLGVQNPDDRATALSAQQLVKPLAEFTALNKPDWTVETFLKEETTKERFEKHLGGSETPAFLFTASHGMGFENGSSRQLRHQGALLCQDWQGPEASEGAISEDLYFSADDIGDDARLNGLIAFHFACYSAGTPALDEFFQRLSDAPTPIAPYNFVARLPQRLLSHPKGGALAVVGHNERAWGCSFIWDQAGQQLQTFESTLKRLLNGHPIGSAFDYFNERYAELASDLYSELDELRYGKTPNDLEIAYMWTASNDARNYTIIGDPAVRLVI